MFPSTSNVKAPLAVIVSKPVIAKSPLLYVTSFNPLRSVAPPPALATFVD